MLACLFPFSRAAEHLVSLQPLPTPPGQGAELFPLCCFQLTLAHHHPSQNGPRCIFSLLLFCQPALFSLVLIYGCTRGYANGKAGRDRRCVLRLCWRKRSAACISMDAPRYGSAERAFNLVNVSPNLSQSLFSLQHML